MKNGQHLLVIRLSAMGDVAMTVPVLLALTQQNPEINITVLTKKLFAPIFSQIPNVAVYVADVQGRHKGFLGLRKLYQELKLLQIDQVADLHNVLRSNILKVFFKLGGYKFAQIDKGRNEKKALVSGPHKELNQLKTSHQRYVDVFEQLGYSFDLKKTTLLSKSSLSAEFIQKAGLNSYRKVGIAPFAAFPGKTYPLRMMEEVIKLLNSSEKYQIVLFGGGKKEKAHLANWEEKYENAITACGKHSFQEELQIISNLDLMLAMDSGNGHLAANYGVPVISVWGVTHPSAGFAPFGQDSQNLLLADRAEFPLIPTSIYGNKMPPGYEKAIETVSPQKIVTKINELLD